MSRSKWFVCRKHASLFHQPSLWNWFTHARLTLAALVDTNLHWSPNNNNPQHMTWQNARCVILTASRMSSSSMSAGMTKRYLRNTEFASRSSSARVAATYTWHNGRRFHNPDMCFFINERFDNNLLLNPILNNCTHDQVSKLQIPGQV